MLSSTDRSLVSQFHRIMDDVNRFCSHVKFSSVQALELREYFHETRALMRARNRAQVTTNLSPQLSAKVAWQMHKHWLVKIDFLADTEKPFLTSLALLMEHAVFAPTERCPASRLYVIFQGVARYDTRPLSKGCTFGERDVLLQNKYSKKPTAIAITYLHVHYVTREVIQELAGSGDYPNAFKSIRRWVRVQALKDYMLHLLRSDKQEQQKKAREASAAAASAKFSA